MSEQIPQPDNPTLPDQPHPARKNPLAKLFAHISITHLTVRQRPWTSLG